MGPLTIVALVIGLILLGIILFAQAKILKSKGINGWLILIPGYGEYLFFKETADCGLLWLALLVIAVLGYFSTMLSFVFGIFFLILFLFFDFVYCVNVAEAYDLSIPFAVGLFLLPPVFFWMLAFPSEETEPYDKRMLRFLSLATAVGLIIFSIGFSSVMYYNKSMDIVVSAYADNPDLNVNQKKLTADQIRQSTSAGMKADERTILKTVYSYDDATLNDREKVPVEKLTALRDWLKDEVIKPLSEQYGTRYGMMTDGLYLTVCIILGAVAVLASVVLWFMFGGRPGNLVKATLWPAVLAGIAGAVAIFLIYSGTAPVPDPDAAAGFIQFTGRNL